MKNRKFLQKFQNFAAFLPNFDRFFSGFSRNAAFFFLKIAGKRYGETRESSKVHFKNKLRNFKKLQTSQLQKTSNFNFKPNLISHPVDILEHIWPNFLRYRPSPWFYVQEGNNSMFFLMFIPIFSSFLANFE